MPQCPQCPGRVFKDDDAVRMHRESYKHTSYSCALCNKVLKSQQAFDQHIRDKRHSSECRYCDRTFNSEDARQQHESAKHAFECNYCDDIFPSESARDEHEDANHSTFECRHCDREFNSEQAREQHENAKHTFECRHCERTFNSEDAREQHENAKHAFECHYCDREFSTEGARDQHEDTKHRFKCNLCSMVFSQVATLRQHEQTTSHFKCSYCVTKFFTSTSKNSHELACARNPVNYVIHPTTAFSDRPSSIHPGEVLSSSVVTRTDKESNLLASPSRSSLDGGEMFHSTSDLPSTDANGRGAIPQPCVRAHSIEPCTCSICQRTSSLSSNTDKPVPNDADIVDSLENKIGSQNLLEPTLQCTPCLKSFETEEALRHHVCAFRTTTPRPHCPVCYTQFDDGPLLQRHLEGLQAFSCQLCLTRCCSDEMLEDHLLSHPTCSKCGKSFADNLALCAHVDSDHPVVVCWDCDGIVVEKNSLELHYADSSAHPTCAFCGMGTRNSADMDEHVKHAHASNAEMKDYPKGDDINARNTDEGFPLAGTCYLGADQEESTGEQSQELGSPPVVEPDCILLYSEPSLSLSPQPPISLCAEEVPQNAIDEEGPDVGQRQCPSPSPTPSEHGSDASRLQLLASRVTNIATNNDTRPPSPVSSESGASPSDLSSPMSSSSSNSVVFVSADGIPDYIRENRAVLVATSSGSPSSSCAPLRLSSSSLGSFDMSRLTRAREVRVSNVNDAHVPRTGAAMAAGAGTGATYHLHCRICHRDPCEDMTATICGHVFCKRCITQAVIAKSECPVCGSATLLYCLFKLDLLA